MFEDVGADEEIEDALLVFFFGLGFHLLVDPAAAFRGVDVVDFDADSGGVDGAGFAGVFAVVFEFGRFAGAEEAEGVEVALEISPLAVGAENAFTFRVGAVGFCDGGGGAAVGGLGFRGHRSAVTRIKDAGVDAQDSSLEKTSSTTKDTEDTEEICHPQSQKPHLSSYFLWLLKRRHNSPPERDAEVKLAGTRLSRGDAVMKCKLRLIQMIPDGARQGKRHPAEKSRARERNVKAQVTGFAQRAKPSRVIPVEPPIQGWSDPPRRYEVRIEPAPTKTMTTLGTPTLLGIPFDAYSSYLRGAGEAPAKIREAMRCDASNSGTELGVDLGVGGLYGDAGELKFAEKDAFAAIEAGVGALIDAGKRPVSLGGDHSITYPIVKAVGRRHPELTIFHFDAHPDLYDEFEGNRQSHACPFARIMEAGLAKRLVQVGIRTMNRHQREQAQKFGVDVVEMRGLPAFAKLKAAGAVYITFDMDVLDPAFAPGVSHREPGGMSVREAIAHLHAIGGEIVGADLVEHNPVQDVAGATATVAAKILKEILGKMIAGEI